MVEENINKFYEKDNCGIMFRCNKLDMPLIEGKANCEEANKKLPVFSQEYEKVSYLDGCKVYFPDDSFVICRPSGTEPLLRVFAEAPTREQANAYIEAWKNTLSKM